MADLSATSGQNRSATIIPAAHLTVGRTARIVLESVASSLRRDQPELHLGNFCKTNMMLTEPRVRRAVILTAHPQSLSSNIRWAAPIYESGSQHILSRQNRDLTATEHQNSSTTLTNGDRLSAVVRLSPRTRSSDRRCLQRRHNLPRAPPTGGLSSTPSGTHRACRYSRHLRAEANAFARHQTVARHCKLIFLDNLKRPLNWEPIYSRSLQCNLMLLIESPLWGPDSTK